MWVAEVRFEKKLKYRNVNHEDYKLSEPIRDPAEVSRLRSSASPPVYVIDVGRWRCELLMQFRLTAPDVVYLIFSLEYK